jgi:4-alpha-glucanotransferase
MYVVQYEMSAGQRPLHRVPSDSVASLNTHDMPPFAAFWQDMDIEERLDLGLLDKAGGYRERRNRQMLKTALVSFLARSGRLEPDRRDTAAVLKGCLGLLAAGPARVLLVNLEDLWLETRPQNIPGTSEEHPNWRRKARYGIEELRRNPEVIDVLQEIDHSRNRRGGDNGAA